MIPPGTSRSGPIPTHSENATGQAPDARPSDCCQLRQLAAGMLALVRPSAVAPIPNAHPSWAIDILCTALNEQPQLADDDDDPGHFYIEFA